MNIIGFIRYISPLFFPILLSLSSFCLLQPRMTITGRPFCSIRAAAPIILVFILLSSFAANAQKQWTLQEAIEYAIRNNITVKQTELSEKLSSTGYTQSKLALLPSVNASSSYTNNFGRSVDPFTYEFTNKEIQSANFSMSGNLAVFNGFQLMNGLMQSRYEYFADRENVARIKNDISLNVAASYLQVLYAQESLKAAADRVEAAKETRNRAKLMFEAGSMAQGGFLDAEAALAAEELGLINAQNVLKTALITLTQLLELPSDEGFGVSVPEVLVPESSALALKPDEIFSAAMKNLPEFRVSMWNIKSAEKGLSIARGIRMPRLSLLGSINSGYSSATRRLTGEKVSFNDQIDENYNKSVGLSLSIPIFNGWSANAGVSRSKINLENVKLSAQLTHNQVYKSVVQAHADANAALLRYDAAQKSMAAAGEALVYADKKFSAGLLSSVEFLNVRNNRTRAETDLIQAKYDLVFRIKVIDFYLGKPLQF